MRLTYAFCTYNRAGRLERLVQAMRAQDCPIPFEILAVNNASTDHTKQVLTQLQRQPGPPLRVVTETVQGIVPARNRALEESMDSDILVFIDDDELPRPGLLSAVFDAIVNEGAECVGGRVKVNFGPVPRPPWLGDDLLGFLAQVDYGEQAFWITDTSTPIWTANVAYAMHLFRNNPTLRFDSRYNRVGHDIGGGEDAILFRTLLECEVKIRYRPDMVVDHIVEPWRLTRGYFLKLHYRGGLRQGRYQLPDHPRKLFGAPPFLYLQLARQCFRTAKFAITRKPGLLRQAMNAAHTFGMIRGYRQRTLKSCTQ